MQFKHIDISKPLKLNAPSHRHKEWELIYNAQGYGTMTVNGVEYPFSEGTVLLCPPQISHDKYSEQGFTDYYIKFDGTDLPTQVHCFQDSYDQRLLQLIRVLHSIFYEGQMLSVCTNLLDAIIGIIKPMLVATKQSPYVQMLQQAIATGYADPDFSLSRAMDAIPVNRDHLRRLFIRQTGQAPHDYLVELRINKAKRLLCEENNRIAEVAYRCGFYDALYFSKVFRKATGVPPTQWR